MVPFNHNKLDKNIHKVKSEVKKYCLSLNHEKEKIKECPICYDTIEKNNYIVTKCNHIFCNDCLFKSLKKQSCCPICRKEIFKFNELKELDDDDIDELESRNSLFKTSLLITTIEQLLNAVEFSMENNICDCIDDDTKKTLTSYFKCSGFRIILKRLFYTFISTSFKIVSVYNYENITNWLKEKNN